MIDLELRRAGAGDVATLNRLMHASRAYDGVYRAMLDGYFVTEAQVARDHVVMAFGGRQVATCEPAGRVAWTRPVLRLAP